MTRPLPETIHVIHTPESQRALGILLSESGESTASDAVRAAIIRDAGRLIYRRLDRAWSESEAPRLRAMAKVIEGAHVIAGWPTPVL